MAQTVALKEGPVEKRQNNRYRLSATVIFTWKTDSHQVLRGEGHTRDCSTTGAFIISPDQPSIGSSLQLVFSLPRLLAAGPGTQLKIRGRVVRTEPEGFAVLAKMSPNSLRHGQDALPASGPGMDSNLKQRSAGF